MNIYKYTLDGSYVGNEYYIVAENFEVAENLIQKTYTNSKIASMKLVNDTVVMVQDIKTLSSRDYDIEDSNDVILLSQQTEKFFSKPEVVEQIAKLVESNLYKKSDRDTKTNDKSDAQSRLINDLLCYISVILIEGIYNHKILETLKKELFKSIWVIDNILNDGK